MLSQNIVWCTCTFIVIWFEVFKIKISCYFLECSIRWTGFLSPILKLLKKRAASRRFLPPDSHLYVMLKILHLKIANFIWAKKKIGKSLGYLTFCTNLLGKPFTTSIACIFQTIWWINYLLESLPLNWFSTNFMHSFVKCHKRWIERMQLIGSI